MRAGCGRVVSSSGDAPGPSREEKSVTETVLHVRCMPACAPSSRIRPRSGLRPGRHRRLRRRDQGRLSAPARRPSAMSHATARTRRAGTSFESQAVTGRPCVIGLAAEPPFHAGRRRPYPAARGGAVAAEGLRLPRRPISHPKSYFRISGNHWLAMPGNHNYAVENEKRCYYDKDV